MNLKLLTVHDTHVTHVNPSGGRMPSEIKTANTVIDGARWARRKTDKEKVSSVRMRFFSDWASTRRRSLPIVISNADIPNTAEVTYDRRYLFYLLSSFLFLCLYNCGIFFFLSVSPWICTSQLSFFFYWSPTHVTQFLQHIYTMCNQSVAIMVMLLAITRAKFTKLLLSLSVLCMLAHKYLFMHFFCSGWRSNLWNVTNYV